MAQHFSTGYVDKHLERLRNPKQIDYFPPPRVAPTLSLIIGPVFAGKTTELGWRMAEAMRNGKSVLLITSSKDVRYPFMTHDAAVIGSIRTLPPQGTMGGRRCISTNNLLEVRHIPEQEVFIDEGHFFTDLAAGVKSLMERGKHVTVATINTTCEFEPIQRLSEIMPYATAVMHKTALCADRKDGCQVVAPYFQYTNGKPKDMVGGADKYKPTCWNCAHK